MRSSARPSASRSARSSRSSTASPRSTWRWNWPAPTASTPPPRSARPDFLKAAAAARLSATEAYDTAARDCVQIHGGVGVTWEQGLHLHMRRARSLAVECGNMFAWEDVLARELTGVAL